MCLTVVVCLALWPLGLGRYRGWWNGVAMIDVNNDGRLDIVASNWGRNSFYETPLREGGAH